MMSLRATWALAIAAAAGLRLWNALIGPVLHGYDGWAHIAYVLFIDLYHAVPFPDQGWSYFHPPLYYGIGAAIAQVDDGDVLVRGLMLIGSAASLGVALLAARLVAAARSEHWLESRGACIAFTGVAFLPVLVYTAPMPGNEVPAALAVAAMLTSFSSGQRAAARGEPSFWLDLITGLLAGCAILTKVSAAIPIAAIGVSGLVTALRSLNRGAALAGLARRGAWMIAAFALLAGPYYGRNVAHFGTPFVTSHEHPKVKAMELQQPPGERSVWDFVALPGPAVLRDSSFDAPHVLRSVWGSVYLNTWFDTYRASQFPRWEIVPPNDYPIHRETLLLAGLGLIPTGFALWGGLLMLRSAWRDRDAVVDQTLSLVTLGSLAFFAAFAVRIPTFAAIKASYLLALSVPYGWALARGLGAALGARSPRLRAVGLAGGAGLGLSAVAVCAILASGALYPARPDQRDIHALRAFFGDSDTAREWLREPGVAQHRHAVEVLGAIELAEGNYAAAAERLRAIASGSVTPEFVNAVATATALSGRAGEAVQMWDRALRASTPAELRINRGTLRAASGDWAGGRRDIEQGLAQNPEVGVGWGNLAWIDRALGKLETSRTSEQRAAQIAQRAPRRFPYGVGDGDLDYAGRGQRWLLVLSGPSDAPELSLYRPERARYGPASR